MLKNYRSGTLSAYKNLQELARHRLKALKCNQRCFGMPASQWGEGWDEIIYSTAFQYSRPLHLNQRCLWFARMHGQWFEAAFRKLRKPETLGIVRKTRKVMLKKARGSPPSWVENQDIALVKKRKTLGKGSINFDVFQTCFVLFHSLPDFRRLAVINHSFRGHG